MQVMAWFDNEVKLTWVQSFCANVLKSGRIPKHVALIMDGNRRFAKIQCLNPIHGHMKGFDKLTETLQWCREFGITEVTVYAFSIENFKRSQEEVSKLMDLAREKFKELMEEKDKLMENGICIRVLGDLTHLPRDLQKLVAETVLLSRDNNKAMLNICLAYTSRDEIFQAVKEVCEGVQLNLIRPSDISERVLGKCLYSSESPDPDMLLRTSGETRLSDFLLWQSSYSVLAFVSVLWPNFSIWNFFSAILYYQMHCNRAMAMKDSVDQLLLLHGSTCRDNYCRRDENLVSYQSPVKELKRRSEEEEEFLQLRSDWKSAADEIKATLSECRHGEIDEMRVAKKCAAERESRVDAFLKYVRDKRIKALENMLA